jgi:hypothetical protein
LFPRAEIDFPLCKRVVEDWSFEIGRTLLRSRGAYIAAARPRQHPNAILRLPRVIEEELIYCTEVSAFISFSNLYTSKSNRIQDFFRQYWKKEPELLRHAFRELAGSLQGLPMGALRR